MRPVAAVRLASTIGLVMGALGGVGTTAVTAAAPRGPVAAPTATCTQPYVPLYGSTFTGTDSSSTKQVWPTNPVTAPDTTGTDLDYVRPRFLAGPDTDGDGRGDEVEIDMSTGEQVMVITRGDGVVRVGLAGFNLGDLLNRPLGDLDADGRDEVLFLARPFAAGDDRIFVLPGATPVGSHQADDVAIQIPTYFLYGAGDQVAGPGDDLIATVFAADPATEGHSAIVSGEAVMAPGPGGALDTFPEAERLDGFPSGVFDLGDPAPAIATTTGTPQRVVVLLRRGGTTTRFVTAGQAVLNGMPSGVGATRTADGTLLGIATGDRGGGASFLWDIDDPCRVLPASAGPVTPSPSPAAPVDGAPDYTG